MWGTTGSVTLTQGAQNGGVSTSPITTVLRMRSKESEETDLIGRLGKLLKKHLLETKNDKDTFTEDLIKWGMSVLREANEADPENESENALVVSSIRLQELANEIFQRHRYPGTPHSFAKEISDWCQDVHKAEPWYARLNSNQATVEAVLQQLNRLGNAAVEVTTAMTADTAACKVHAATSKQEQEETLKQQKIESEAKCAAAVAAIKVTIENHSQVISEWKRKVASIEQDVQVLRGQNSGLGQAIRESALEIIQLRQCIYVCQDEIRHLKKRAKRLL